MLSFRQFNIQNALTIAEDYFEYDIEFYEIDINEAT